MSKRKDNEWPFPCQIVDKGEDPKDHPMHTCPKCLKGIDLELAQSRLVERERESYTNYEVWCADAKRRGFFIDEDMYEDGDRAVTHLATDQPGDREPADWNVMGEFTVDPAGRISAWLRRGT